MCISVQCSLVTNSACAVQQSAVESSVKPGAQELPPDTKDPVLFFNVPGYLGGGGGGGGGRRRGKGEKEGGRRRKEEKKKGEKGELRRGRRQRKTRR